MNKAVEQELNGTAVVQGDGSQGVLAVTLIISPKVVREFT